MKRLQFLVLIFFAATVVVFAQEKAEKLGPKTVKQAVIDNADSPTASIKKSNGTATVASYDFTQSTSTPGDQFYGGAAAAVEVEPGVWAMAAGDANADGNVTTSDYNLWLPQNNAAATGYLATDMNLDGNVTTSDYNLWLPNNNAAKSTQVP